MEVFFEEENDIKDHHFQGIHTGRPCWIPTQENSYPSMLSKTHMEDMGPHQDIMALPLDPPFCPHHHLVY